jgi:hypothetical protein
VKFVEIRAIRGKKNKAQKKSQTPTKIGIWNFKY